MNLPDEKREAVCLALAEQHGCVVEAEDTGRLLTCRGCAEQADALAPLLVGWLAEAEELIAALRARVSHAEAERDEAFRVAPNMGAAVYERGKRDGLAEGEARVRARVEAVERSIASAAGQPVEDFTVNAWRQLLYMAAHDLRAALDVDAAETTEEV